VLVLLLLVLVAACGLFRPPDVAAPARAGVSSAAPTVPSPASGKVWHIVALGDSVTSGGPCDCTPFPQRYGEEIAHVRGVRTSTQNLGVGGLDSQGLLAMLRDRRSPVWRAVGEADIDLVTIGANDFSDQHHNVTSGRCLGRVGTECVSDELATLQRNVAAVVTRIRGLRGHRRTAVLVTGYWNVFEDGAVARRSFRHNGVRATKRLTVLANDEIRRAARRSGATYVDLYEPFEGPPTRGDPTRLLGPDGDHPNAAGQELIAKRLLAAGLPGLAEG
jgi:lysophospholipase L1-like esterase